MRALASPIAALLYVTPAPADQGILHSSVNAPGKIAQDSVPALNILYRLLPAIIQREDPP